MTPDNSAIAVKAEIRNAVQGFILSLPLHNSDMVARVVIEAITHLSHNSDGAIISESPIKEISNYPIEQLMEWVLEAVEATRKTLPPERSIKAMTKKYIEAIEGYGGTKLNMGNRLELVEVKKEHNDRNNMIELVDGTWITGPGDGSYHTDGNELERWARIMISEIDEEGDYIESKYLGFTRV